MSLVFKLVLAIKPQGKINKERNIWHKKKHMKGLISLERREIISQQDVSIWQRPQTYFQMLQTERADGAKEVNLQSGSWLVFWWERKVYRDSSVRIWGAEGVTSWANCGMLVRLVDTRVAFTSCCTWSAQSWDQPSELEIRRGDQRSMREQERTWINCFCVWGILYISLRASVAVGSLSCLFHL